MYQVLPAGALEAKEKKDLVSSGAALGSVLCLAEETGHKEMNTETGWVRAGHHARAAKGEGKIAEPVGEKSSLRLDWAWKVTHSCDGVTELAAEGKEAQQGPAGKGV